MTVPTRLTRTGLRLSEIGQGAAQLGNLFREISDDDAAATVRAAWDAGVRYFDTAPHYGLGLSEARLGAALAAYPRDEYVVSTKVGRLLVESPETASARDSEGFDVPATRRRQWDFSRDGIRRSLDGSLQRLGLDRIDIAYLHDPDEHWAAASTTGVDALVELRDEGVVTAIGAGMNQAEMLTRFVESTDIDLVMCAGRLTLLEQASALPLLDAAAARGVGVVAAGVFNSGLLSTATIRPDAHFDYGEAPAHVLERARRIADICERHGVLLPHAAVQYPLRFGPVVSVVVGMRGPTQALSAVEARDASIPQALWDELDAAGLAVESAA